MNETKKKILEEVEDMINEAKLELMRETDQKSKDYALIKALTLEMVYEHIRKVKADGVEE